LAAGDAATTEPVPRLSSSPGNPEVPGSIPAPGEGCTDNIPARDIAGDDEAEE
jgi:hypothetical protein